MFKTQLDGRCNWVCARKVTLLVVLIKRASQRVEGDALLQRHPD